ncbi:epididymal protein 13 [Bos taurus]|uniref:epididymal protein 13 n=1 Tax=Bos taurus TaxID=9913 RepID=UPI0028CB6FB4|nr:epididymal protein 13 [Bos taurus]
MCGQLASPLESERTVSDQSLIGPERSSSTPTHKPTVHKSGPSLKMFLLILLFLGLADACIPREVATEEKTKPLSIISPNRSPRPQWTLFPRLSQLPASDLTFGFLLMASSPWSLVPPFCITSVSSTTVPTLDRLLSGIVGMMSRLSVDGVRLRDSSSKTPSLAPPQDRTEEESLLSLQVLNEESSGCKEEVKFLPTATTPKKPLKKKTGWNGLRCAYMMVTFLFVSYNKGDWCYCHYCDPQVDNRNNPCCAF